MNFDAAKFKVQHRSHTLDALNHASGNGREELFGRVEGVRPAVGVRVENDLGIFGGSYAAACGSTRRTLTLYSSIGPILGC